MLHELLHKIQKNLNCPKNHWNSFGKYNYRSCEDIVEAVKDLLEPNCSLLLSDKIVNIGNSNYIEATATLTDGKDSISVTGYAREALTVKGMGDSQITGATSSYARKYALNGLFAIDDTKDADTNEHKQDIDTRPEPVITIEELDSLIRQTDSDYEKLLDYYKVSILKDLTTEQRKKLKAQLERKL
jgi:hypothetical protein